MPKSRQKAFYNIGPGRSARLSAPLQDFSGQDDVDDDADDDGRREDDEVRSVAGDQDVGRHLGEALVDQEPVGQEVEDDVGQAEEDEQGGEGGPRDDQRHDLSKCEMQCATHGD